ncbi:MAG: glycoside hydrolase family 3 C-terminal domain-containing protein [Benjaminiella poitrasii]|nr:MAG: glycoside hydrolase family 3 C-terminal domain-containing protein [Benjaminiella poitrasii]
MAITVLLTPYIILLEDGTLNRTAARYFAENFFVGFYLNSLSSYDVLFDAAGYADLIEEIHEITLSANSTCKIPILYGLDSIHDAQLIANSKTFALNIPMNIQWPCVFENFGEDSHLSSILGAASIRDYQSRYKSNRSKLAAYMKHFIVYGAPYSGQDHNSIVISERDLYDYFVPIERLDESVGHLLQLKKDLGLLAEGGWRVDRALQRDKQSRKDIEIDLEAARQSITLLENKNETLSLLDKSVKKVLVIDPSCDDLSHLAGGCTIFWQGATEDGYHGDVNDTQFYDHNMDLILERVQGCGAFVVCIGEHIYAELLGMIHDLALLKGQVEHVQRLSGSIDFIHLVTVLVEDQPRVLDTIHGNSNVILLTYLPGPWDSQAVGEILLGLTNPSGLLPYTYPRHPFYLMAQLRIRCVDCRRTRKRSVNSHIQYQSSCWLRNPPYVYSATLPYSHSAYQSPQAFQKVFVTASESVSVQLKISADLFRYTGLQGVPGGTIGRELARILIDQQQLELQIL